jgi:hypothetical protein
VKVLDVGVARCALEAGRGVGAHETIRGALITGVVGCVKVESLQTCGANGLSVRVASSALDANTLRTKSGVVNSILEGVSEGANCAGVVTVAGEIRLAVL